MTAPKTPTAPAPHLLALQETEAQRRTLFEVVRILRGLRDAGQLECHGTGVAGPEAN